MSYFDLPVPGDAQYGMNTSVSVIIPTYKRRLQVCRAIESVLQQTRVPDEVIVVDDGSGDGTAGWLITHYPQVRLVARPTCQGVSAARNRGIAEATGEWLAFLDSDDEWLPGKMARQLAALAREPAYRLVHSDEIWIRNGRRVNPMKKHRKTGGDIFQHCLPLCAISPSAVMIHRSVFDAVGGFDESLPACEDYDLWLRITARYPVLYINEPLINKYGGHADQLSRRYWGMDRFRIRALEKIVRDPVLSMEQREAVVTMLLEKIDIYINGARKRERGEEVKRYQDKRARYAAEGFAAMAGQP
jgi:glycosyltransferase involved in cell wall biosynthesis